MWRATASVGALGLEIALSIIIGGGVGYYLDLKLNTHWIMYVGLCFGIAAAIKSLVRVTRAAKRAFPDDDGSQNQDMAGKKDDKDNKKPGGGGAGPN
jgi:F0F1-type ATP synthase assembly protein I